MALSLIGTTKEGIPVMLLKEGTNQRKGKAAQASFIEAAKALADMLKPVLGPRGLDKMLVTSFGDVTITNDGATILKEMDIEHPAAKMMVEVAKTVDAEVGDGTTSSVILAGALLEQAQILLNQGVHPAIIVDGFKKALNASLTMLSEIAEKVSKDDVEMLRYIAKTSMESKIVSTDSDILADLAVKAVLSVAEPLHHHNKEQKMMNTL